LETSDLKALSVFRELEPKLVINDEQRVPAIDVLLDTGP
jgi:hypothetical protein